ncbi:MAG: ABC transporter permease [Synergistaceae bacterium]|jgi:simple sugar transport system permease protein|nr:ABC transporter permease [Synergistaceae bacterium]
MSLDMIVNWMQATLRWSVPLILVSTGEVFAERSGVINMGIEGIMLSGALCGIAVSFFTGGVFMAVLVTMALGAMMGLAVAFLTVSRRTNQVVTGLMINMLAMGGTNLLFALLSESRRTRVATFPVLFPQSMHNIPIIGPILFKQPISTWVALILPILSGIVLYKTTWGLNVRAVGDNPQSAATVGLSVIKIKYQTVVLSGIFAALGGCVLTLGEVGYFASGGMTAGRGFIVLAAVVVGGWDPFKTALACLVFGAADAAQLRFQAMGSVIPYQFLQMLPYLVTVIALTIMVEHSRVPKTWGAAYDRRDV